jgi:nitrogen-specific signal transduction histidine kinase
VSPQPDRRDERRSALPSRRFAQARTLIAASLFTLLAMVGVELFGVSKVTRTAEERARAGALAVARVAASVMGNGEAPRFAAALAAEGGGVTVFNPDGTTHLIGDRGPSTPLWWPWRSRQDWERGGAAATGPLAWGGQDYVVAYLAISDGRVIRVVQRSAATHEPLAGAWLALLVASAGALLAWVLISRALAPYRELLAEAVRVTRGRSAEMPEDRFLVETFRDTVQRLETSELALRHRADELALLADVLTRESAAGVVITDAAGLVRACNGTAVELLGASLAPGHELPALLGSESGQVRLEGRTLEVRAFPLRSSSGETQGQVAFLADRTRVESLERALAEREQMASLGELAAGMTHELRNALATIRGYLRLLREADGERRERYLAAVDGEAASLVGILDRFLRFAQPHELKRESVELAALLAETIARVRALHPAVSFDIIGSGGRCDADRMAILAALENLIRNAAEAVAPAAGHVVVRVEHRAGRALIHVEDDGPGLHPDVAERLFQPFVTSKPSGGLGLALARRFARLHGGDVSFEPLLPRGCRFTLELPDCEAP